MFKYNGILFCNIAYMKYYDIDEHNEIPVNGGAYVKDTKDALEKYNFHFCNDGFIRGFVETKYVNGYKGEDSRPKELHIEKINGSHKNKDEINNVMVVFCAKNPDKAINTSVIIGWYKNATVYRNRKTYVERQYNIITKQENSFLLPESLRTFKIPRASKSNNYLGFGQANVWYANKEEHINFVKKVINYIENQQNNHENDEEDIKLNLNLSNSKINNKEFEYSNTLVKKADPISTQSGYVYKRERQTAVNALIHAKFKCEIDSEHKLFNRKSDGLPYTEAHHLIPMKKQDLFEYSLDIEENIVSLCSHCHNEIHYGIDAKKLIEKLYNQRREVLEKKNLKITLQELLSFYDI